MTMTMNATHAQILVLAAEAGILARRKSNAVPVESHWLGLLPFFADLPGVGQQEIAEAKETFLRALDGCLSVSHCSGGWPAEAASLDATLFAAIPAIDAATATVTPLAGGGVTYEPLRATPEAATDDATAGRDRITTGLKVRLADWSSGVVVEDEHEVFATVLWDDSGLVSDIPRDQLTVIPEEL